MVQAWHVWQASEASQQACLAGSDEASDDLNKLKTKVRRLYDIANVLTSLNLIAKVHMKPSRKPGFQWLGIENICLHSEQAIVQHPSVKTDAGPPAPPALNAQGTSEDPSSTATGSSMHQRDTLPHATSCNQPPGNFLHDDSLSSSSQQLKRSAATLDPPSSLKRSRISCSQPMQVLAPQLCQTEVMQPACAVPLCIADQQTGEESNKVSSSPGMATRPDAMAACKSGTRPTPVPITPEGGQPEAQYRHQVCPGPLHGVLPWSSHLQICITLHKVGQQ